MSGLSYKNEILRKTVHLSSLIYPLIYLNFGKIITLIILLLAFATTLIWELSRIKGYNVIFLNLIIKTLRLSEAKSKKLSGAVPFLLSCLVVVLFFNMHIAVLSMFVLIFCDTIAAIFGRKVPIFYFKNYQKSLGGFVAFVLCGLFIVSLYAKFYNPSASFYKASVIAVFSSALAEFIAKKVKIDDNILISIIFASTLFIIAANI